jgi:hypothetical protein
MHLSQSNNALKKAGDWMSAATILTSGAITVSPKFTLELVVVRFCPKQPPFLCQTGPDLASLASDYDPV